MPYFSKIYLMGHVGNIQIKPTRSGNTLTTFSIAVSKKQNGEKRTDWYNVATSLSWVSKSLKKGDLVFIVGTPSMNKVGGKTYLNIWIEEIQILSKSKQNDDLTVSMPEFDDFDDEEDSNDEIPF